MISIFTLALAADESREVAISGEYFEIRNALFPIVLVELLDRSGGVISRLDNPEQSDFVKPGRFETVRITNGATAQVVKHFYGSGDAGSRRTSGLVRIDGTSDVSVIDGGKNRTLASKSFVWSANVTANAGFPPIAQLRNISTAKNLFLKSIYGTGGVSMSISLMWRAAAHGAVVADSLVPKLFSGVQTVAESRVAVAENNVPDIPYSIVNFNTAASQTFGLILQDPVCIAPGQGVVVVASVTGSQFLLSAEYVEEII